VFCKGNYQPLRNVLYKVIHLQQYEIIQLCLCETGRGKIHLAINMMLYNLVFNHEFLLKLLNFWNIREILMYPETSTDFVTNSSVDLDVELTKVKVEVVAEMGVEVVVVVICGVEVVVVGVAVVVVIGIKPYTSGQMILKSEQFRAPVIAMGTLKLNESNPFGRLDRGKQIALFWFQLKRLHSGIS
jgi:hypothetical protein